MNDVNTTKHGSIWERKARLKGSGDSRSCCKTTYSQIALDIVVFTILRTTDNICVQNTTPGGR